VATRIGSAYFDVTARTEGAQSAIGRLAAVIGGAAKAAVGVIIGLGASVAALALSGGIARALQTEQATVQLRRMGLATADIEKIVQDVDKAFDGTVFTNPEGFVLTQRLIGAGVELEKIPDMLRVVADFAAHGNVPLSQMTDIFEVIIGQEKVTARELQRLAQANIPIGQLAEAMGMSVKQLREMTSEGEFTADMFLEAALGAGVFEGAAKAAGDTTVGAWKNVRSQLARLGELVVSPMFGEGGPLVTLFQALRQALIDLRPQAEYLGEIIQNRLVPHIQDASRWLSTGGLAGAIDSAKDAIGRILGPIFDMWNAFNEGSRMRRLPLAERIGNALAAGFDAIDVKGMADSLASKLEDIFEDLPDRIDIDDVGDNIAGLLDDVFGDIDWRGTLDYIVDRFTPLAGLIADRLRGYLGQVDWAGLFSGVQGGAQTAFNGIVTWLETGGIEQILTTIINAKERLIMAGLRLFPALIEALQQTLPLLLDILVNEILPAVFDFLIDQAPELLEAGLELFVTLSEALIEALPDLLDTLVNDVIPTLIETLLDMVPDLLEAGIELFLALVEALLDILPDLIHTFFFDVLPAVLEAILEMAPDILLAAVEAFLMMTEALIDVIPEILLTITSPEFIGKIIQAIIDTGPELLLAMFEAAIQMGKGIYDAIPELINALVRPPDGVIPTLLRILGEQIEKLVEIGKDILGGLWEGMKAKWHEIEDWINGIGDDIRRFFGIATESNSPSEITKRVGADLMAGLLVGMDDEWMRVARYISNRDFAGLMPAAFTPTTPGAQGWDGASAFGAAPIMIQTTGDAAVLAQEIESRLDFRRAVGGRTL
jgi:tape measure domain-containing protein